MRAWLRRVTDAFVSTVSDSPVSPTFIYMCVVVAQPRVSVEMCYAGIRKELSVSRKRQGLSSQPLGVTPTSAPWTRSVIESVKSVTSIFRVIPHTLGKYKGTMDEMKGFMQVP